MVIVVRVSPESNWGRLTIDRSEQPSGSPRRSACSWASDAFSAEAADCLQFHFDATFISEEEIVGDQRGTSPAAVVG